MSQQTLVTKDGPGSSSSTTTVRTTSYETKTSLLTPMYKAMITPRTNVIHRTTYGGPGSTTTRTERVSQQGSPAAVSVTGVTSVKQSRDKEKRDMQDLNERLAGYIEKVRFLEAQNRKIADELEKLKERWGKETTAIKAMYQTELDEARKLLEETEKEKARLEQKAAALEDQLDQLRKEVHRANQKAASDRDRLQRQDQQLSDYEAEVNFLRRRVEGLENDRVKNKKEIARLQDALNHARIDLDNETLSHVAAENNRQTLEEELEFLKEVHEQELKELAALAYRDTTSENREFWKSELARSLHDMQITYDEKVELLKTELDNFYTTKIQEFRTGATRSNMETIHSKEENKRLRTQLTDLKRKIADLEGKNKLLEKELEDLRKEYADKLREFEEENGNLKRRVAKMKAEMEAVLKELQALLDTKLGLELEIAAYRKLLEAEENRVGLRNVIDSFILK